MDLAGDWDHSDRPAIETVPPDLFGAGDGRRRARADGGLAAIASRDRHFDPQSFVDQVRRTFFVVEEAWTAQRPEASRQVMADGLWEQHRSQIEGYIRAGRRNILDGLTILDLDVVEATSGRGRGGGWDTVTVRIRSRGADYDLDGSGRMVRGGRALQEWVEDWTFQRSSAASTPEGGGTLSGHCPGCAMPLELDRSGTCPHCGTKVSSGSLDWVLSRIAQVTGA